MQLDPRRQGTTEGSYGGPIDEEEHSVLDVDSDDGDEQEEYNESSSSSSSLPIPDDVIDFQRVYALDHYPATIEGQANATKGDALFLIDDSNSYWWLVRVLKTEEVGYIPAEIVETPLERTARLNKHRNIERTAASYAELQSDVELAAARIRDVLSPQTDPTASSLQLSPPRTGNTVRNPLDQRRSLAFSCSLYVHRYPPAVWNDEEWLIEREERRAASMLERKQDDDYEYDLLAFDEDEDHEEGEWDVGNFEAEDEKLAEETIEMMKTLTSRERQQVSIPWPNPSPSSLPNEKDVVQKSPVALVEQREPASFQQPAPTTERDKSPSPEATETRSTSVVKNIVQETGQDGEPRRKREREGEEDAARKRIKASEVKPLQTSPPATSTSLAKNTGSKLRKEPATSGEKGSDKKKGSSVFGIFSRRNSKGKNSSSSGSEVGGRSSNDSTLRPSISSSVSTSDGLTSPSAAPTARVIDLRNSPDPKPLRQTRQEDQDGTPQANATSQLRQREQHQHALYKQQHLSRSPPEALSSSSPPSAFLSLPAAPRSRPGSLILTTSSAGDAMGVPELSVLRVFAGENLKTEATFKTSLLHPSTTSEDLIKQAAQRFRLTEIDPRDYYLTVKQVDGTIAVLRSDERPLVVFEGWVESAPRVSKRSSIGSIGSLTSILSNDFADDSAVKLYLNRRLEDGAGANKADVAHPSIVEDVPSSRFTLQLVVYSSDLPGGTVFDPSTEAVIRSSNSPRASQSMRRKVFVLPKNVTVAEVIELGLERFGIEEGVVDGGDEVEDKVSKRKNGLRVRYRLAVDDGSGIERELMPSSRAIDAFLRPVHRPIANKRRSIDSANEVNPDDPTFILRRATSYRISTASRRSISGALDEIALARLYRNSVSSITSVATTERDETQMSRQEIIAAQRQATRANQQAILSRSTSANSLGGMDVLKGGSGPSPDRVEEKLGRVSTRVQNDSSSRRESAGASLRSISPRPNSPARSRSVTPGSAGTPVPHFSEERSSPAAVDARSAPTSAKPPLSSVPAGPQPSDNVSVHATPSAPESPARTPTPKAAPKKRLFLPEDDFGISHMMSVIELRASQTRRPRQAPMPLNPVDEMLFGRKTDLNSLNPKIQDIYVDGLKYLEETDKFLDEFLLNRLSATR
ncbi:hypothetical protein C8F01DRAFT_1154156 [Mycena amicta]|nr:hypothetical protein C8F01DRAFT_1154156 [Mycena amicta]